MQPRPRSLRRLRPRTSPSPFFILLLIPDLPARQTRTRIPRHEPSPPFLLQPRQRERRRRPRDPIVFVVVIIARYVMISFPTLLLLRCSLGGCVLERGARSRGWDCGWG